MIYTCTLNPSLDYYVWVKDWEKGKDHRFTQWHVQAGGKGINVSRFLSMLHIKTTALGFLGGPIGQMLQDLLDDYPYVRSQFIHVDSPTRINIKVMDQNIETAFNHEGSPINSTDIASLLQQIEGLGPDDLLVLSGSVPPHQQEIYQQIASLCHKHQIRWILDVDGCYYASLWPYKPWMVKPNVDELSRYVGKKLNHEKDILDAARSIQKQGVSHVLVSLGSKGSYYLCNDHMSYIGPEKVTPLSTTGAGDSMVAGFIYGMLNGKKGDDLHQWIAQCALNIITGQDINYPRNMVPIRRIDSKEDVT